jgi:hypothetical protein
MVRGLGRGGGGVIQESTVEGKAQRRDGGVGYYFPKEIYFAVSVLLV